ncbi:hypothetical protein BDR04DRAFT_1121769 [Suillus decipiens]|nr:hypothetical protein BDR04DRAFT_1121769 [Suillus decipiens]
MLIDLKANSFMRINEQEKAALVDLKELIDSKDFRELTLRQEFIKNHREVFKILAVLINNMELLAQLSKIVSDLLSSIHGNLKGKLVSSLIKRMSIMDTAKLLAHSIIEVDAAHWNRYAFLALYCDVDIGVSENDEWCTDNTDSNVDYSEEQYPEGDLGVTDDHGDNLGEGEHTLESGEEGSRFQENREEEEAHEEEEAQEEETGQQESEVNNGGSGFSKRKNGKGPKFTSTKFWNFVDCSLQAIRQAAQQEAGPNYNMSAHGTYENAVQNILVEYFQMDLAEFPGSMVVPKLLATTSPQWRTTIQNSLLWN